MLDALLSQPHAPQTDILRCQFLQISSTDSKHPHKFPALFL